MEKRQACIFQPCVNNAIIVGQYELLSFHTVRNASSRRSSYESESFVVKIMRNILFEEWMAFGD